MTYLIAGLDPAQFAPLREMNGDELACAGGRRVVADADDGFACRVTLENARRGDGLFLLHHVHHDVARPYRAAFAIFVGPGTVRAEYRNECPPSFHGRTISMRGFDAGGTMVATSLAPPGTTDTVIRALLVDPQIAYIHAHNAGRRLLRRTDRTGRIMSALDIDEAWQAVLNRDRSYDGRFVTGVLTTGIYCRPSCAARHPARVNVRFFAGGPEARGAGLRACLRCLPDDIARDELAVRQAIDAIKAAAAPLSLGDLAARTGYSPAHFQRVFARATGLSPAAYARALREERAREALSASERVADAIYESGFESPSRFYDSMEGKLGMAPSAWRRGGAGVTIRWAVVDTTLGSMLVAATDKGVCRLAFNEGPESLGTRFPQAELAEGDEAFADLLQQVVAAVERPGTAAAIPLDVAGTAFQQRVWDELRKIPAGETRSYAQIAAAAGNPAAVRAAGSANGANNVAVLIPCHRVIRTDGSLGGYAYGVDIKQALLEREKASR